MRFPLEVLEACREEAGEGFSLELRISGDERVVGGVGLEERVAVPERRHAVHRPGRRFHRRLSRTAQLRRHASPVTTSPTC